MKARDGADQVAKFVDAVEVGEALALDVGNKEGETLVILELSNDQRERAKE